LLGTVTLAIVCVNVELPDGKVALLAAVEVKVNAKLSDVISLALALFGIVKCQAWS
jgi:hypothetical protein